MRNPMKIKGITYRQLADRLVAMGVETDEKMLAQQIRDGHRSAMLFCQCLLALGITFFTVPHPQS